MKFFYAIFIIIVLSSCNKFKNTQSGMNKNEPNLDKKKQAIISNDTAIKTEDVIDNAANTNQLTVIDQDTSIILDNKITNEFSTVDYSTILGNIEKSYYYGYPIEKFPLLASINNTICDSEIENNFFQNNVGYYCDIGSLNNIYDNAFQINSIKTDLGQGYYFGKYRQAISYDSKEKKFSEIDGGGMFWIEDIKGYTVPPTWFRISSPQDPDYIIELINKKREGYSSYYDLLDKNIDENEIRRILSLFFHAMKDNNLTNLLNLCDKKNGIRFNNINNRKYCISDSNIVREFKNIKKSFEYSYIPEQTFNVYINALFSIDPENLIDTIENPVTVEFLFNNSYNYFMLLLSRNSNSYSICYIRNELDSE